MTGQLAFDAAAGVGELGAEDTMALATAAYLMGDVDEAVRALQSGYQDMIKNADDAGRRALRLLARL